MCKLSTGYVQLQYRCITFTRDPFSNDATEFWQYKWITGYYPKWWLGGNKPQYLQKIHNLSQNHSYIPRWNMHCLWRANHLHRWYICSIRIHRITNLNNGYHQYRHAIPFLSGNKPCVWQCVYILLTLLLSPFKCKKCALSFLRVELMKQLNLI